MLIQVNRLIGGNDAVMATPPCQGTAQLNGAKRHYCERSSEALLSANCSGINSSRAVFSDVSIKGCTSKNRIVSPAGWGNMNTCCYPLLDVETESRLND